MTGPRIRERRNRFLRDSPSRGMDLKYGGSFDWGDINPQQICSYEYMSDVNNGRLRPESPCRHEKFDGVPAVYSGTTTYFSGWDNRPYWRTDIHRKFLTSCDYRDAETGHVWQYLPSELDLNTMVWARNNPSNPSLNHVAAAIEGITELPNIWKDAVESLSRNPVIGDVGKVPIAVLFGVLPIVQYITSLATLADDIDARMQQLSRLSSKSGRKSRLTLFNETVKLERDFGVEYISGVNIHEKKSTTNRIDAIVSDRINYSDIKPLKKRFDSNFIRNLMTSDRPIATIWEVLPWSWLIDYFVGVGEFLRATNNAIPGYEVTGVTYLHTTTTRCFWTQKSTGARHKVDGHTTPGHYERVTFVRWHADHPRPGSPRLKPCLTRSQIGTLIALGTAIGTSGSTKLAR